MRTKDIRRYAALLGMALLAGSFGHAQAATATINGVTFPVGIVAGGNTLQGGILFETSITGTGQTLSGVGRIDSINDSLGNVVWQNGNNGVELAFYFTNYVSNTITLPTATNSGQVTFTGGTLNLYTLAAGTSLTTGSQAGDIATVTSGTLFLSATAAVEDASGNTLLAQLPANSTLTAFGGASGGGFLNVVGGPAAAAFDTNTFANPFDTAHNGLSDQSFLSSFSTGASGDFPISGTGSIKANAVPEPASLGLLGLGLLGLGLARRRSRK